MTITKLGAISCDTWYKIIAALAVLGRAAVIVTFTLRTYVVWAQSRIVLISLVMLGLATVLTDAMYVPRQTCENTRGDTATFDLVRSFLTIIFETLSATLILIRSLQAFRRGGSYFINRVQIPPRSSQRFHSTTIRYPDCSFPSPPSCLE
ncbi:hypothetical protein C8R41DRAFT_617102 [Lentinula lateritia]|uniref:Uncharacterized protein n=1 Tax=Lentinula lateritia TaxID=40482 RepID=A0ABQ8V891_9AGAR|nr:hypothetical protein C8R41DRAFT_617102 [Lentinula lateritia]